MTYIFSLSEQKSMKHFSIFFFFPVDVPVGAEAHEAADVLCGLFPPEPSKD